MKRLKFSLLFFFAIAICGFFTTMSEAKAWNDYTGSGASERPVYYIKNVRRQGDYFHIDGYAYTQRIQNYSATNHSFYIYVEQNGKQYNANLFQQSEDLGGMYHIQGVDRRCNEIEDREGSDCWRIINGAGFSVDIPLADFSPDVNYTFKIRIAEYSSGARPEIRIMSPNKNMGQFEWRHNTYSVNSSLNLSRMTFVVDRVLLRNGPSKGYGKINYGRCGSGPHWALWETFSNIYEFNENPTDGPWVRMGFNWRSGCPVKAVNGAGNSGWAYIGYMVYGGQPLTLNTKRKTYIGNVSLETKTARVGTDATIKSTIYNNKDSSGNLNPARVEFYVNNNKVYTSEVEKWSGAKTFSYDLPAASSNRTVKVRIIETTNNKVTELQTTLYGPSKKTYTIENVTGTIQVETPIYVIKTRTNETKYYEKITYNQGEIYHALDDDNILPKNISLSYNTTYPNITTWDNDHISAMNTVSSPQETYSLNKVESEDTKVKFSANKVITYTNLDMKNQVATVSGIGANDVTLKMKANYQFIDASDIVLIDTRTHDKDADGEVYVTLNNQKTRTLHYFVYYKNTLLIDKTETWDGDKLIPLTPLVKEADKIKVDIIQPNTRPETLSGEIYVATYDNVDVKQDATYTSKTPVKVLTTPTSVKKFYETIKITSLDKQPTIKAGEGFENRIKIDYSTTDDIYNLTSSIINVDSIFTQKDEGLSYEEQNDGTYIVDTDKVSVENKSVTTTLPEVKVDLKTGAVYEKNKVPEDREVIDGGRKWYVPMNAVDGNYDDKTIIEQVGINKMTFNIENYYTVSGSLLGNTDSKYKIIRVKNPENPNYTWHKKFSMKELFDQYAN